MTAFLTGFACGFFAALVAVVIVVAVLYWLAKAGTATMLSPSATGESTENLTCDPYYWDIMRARRAWMLRQSPPHTESVRNTSD